MNEAYEAYRALYSHLLRWCLRWVSADVAHALARLGCSEFVRSALSLAQAPYGPFMAAFTSIESALMFELEKSGENRWREMSQDPDIPSEALLHEINRLYVALYHVAYDAQLTWTERESLRLLAAFFTPVPIEGDVREFVLTWERIEALPLRKLARVADHSVTSRDLVCSIAEEAWVEADLRSFRWVRDIMAKRG